MRQVIATDHAVFNKTQKRRGRHDFRQIPNGVNGIEERLHVAWEELVNSGDFGAVTCCRYESEASGLTTAVQHGMESWLCRSLLHSKVVPVSRAHQMPLAMYRRSHQPIGFCTAREHGRGADIRYLPAEGDRVISCMLRLNRRVHVCGHTLRSES